MSCRPAPPITSRRRLLLVLATLLQFARLGNGEGPDGEEIFMSLPLKVPGESRLANKCKELASLLPPPRKPQRILVVLKGLSYNGRYKNGMYNYTRTYENFFSTIVEAWRSQGHAVDVGISTYDSAKLGHIQEVYSPVFLAKAPQPYQAVGRSKIDALLEALQAVQSHGGSSNWDFIVITRFDIKMKMPMTDLSVDFDKFNFPWRQRILSSPFMSSWLKIPRVADSIQMFPSHYLPMAIEATTMMLADGRRHPELSRWNDCHNLMYNLRKLGLDIETEVHFMMTDFCKTKRNHANPIYTQSVATTPRMA